MGQAAEYSGYLNLNAPNMYALIPHGAEVNTAPAARLGILAAFALAAAVLAALLVFRRQADDRALLAAAVVLAIGVPFLLPHMHERYFFLADVLALAWTCAFPRSAPCALLVELASLGAYVVVLRGNLPWRSPWMAACSPCCARPCSCWPAWPLRSSPSPADSPSLKNPESNSLSPTIWHAGTNFL